MLTYVRGDLFDSPAKVLVNTVNTVGVMGKGIARTFKDIYPEMFERYVKLCEQKQLDIGNLWLYRTDHKWVLNFPTKKHWRNPSKIEYIEAGLQKFVDSYAQEKITSIAFPELGCGNGELAWNDVRPLMVRYLRTLPINIYVYLYDRTSVAPAEHKDVASMRKWLRSEPRTLAFDEFWSDIKGIVGSGKQFTKLNTSEQFAVGIVRYDQDGLLLHVGDRTWFQILRDQTRNVVNQVLQKWRLGSKRAIFIPQDSLLELWQSIRFYGFCYSKMMPGGLDLLADYLIPILRELPFLKTVRLSVPIGGQEPLLEDGLQIYVPEVAAEPKQERVLAVSLAQ